MKSYKDLDVYNESFDLALKVHQLSLRLPKHELYETGSQVRRASKSISSNIVEGYGRRAYKQDFVKFLTYAEASLLETISELETIAALYPELETKEMIHSYEELGKRLYTFTEWVKSNWNTQQKPKTNNL